MSIKYELYQDNRSKSENFGKWYARAQVSDVVGLEEISQEIQDNTSAKQADVYAVLKELVNVIGRHLRNGDRVVLEGFGSFKVGLKTKPANSAKDFKAATNIVGARVNFLPETHWSATDKTRRKQLLQGLEVKLADDKKLKEAPGGGGGKPEEGEKVTP